MYIHITCRGRSTYIAVNTNVNIRQKARTRHFCRFGHCMGPCSTWHTPRRHPTVHVHSVDGNFVSIGLSIASHIVFSWHLHHPQCLPQSLPITYHSTFLSSGKTHDILAAKRCYFLTVTVTQSELSLDLGSGNVHKFAPHPTLLDRQGIRLPHRTAQNGGAPPPPALLPPHRLHGTHR